MEAIRRVPRIVLFSDVNDVLEEIPMNPVRFFGGLIVFCALVVGPVIAQETQKMPVEKLIADLASDDGNKRIAATVEIFRRGKAVLPDLKKAGAKQVAPSGTIDSRRLDVVHSLIEELPPNPPGALAGYKTDSFGVSMEKGTTKEEVIQMGKIHGFTLDNTFQDVSHFYVRLNGKSLVEVLQSVLAHEPKVISVNLNYFER